MVITNMTNMRYLDSYYQHEILWWLLPTWDTWMVIMRYLSTFDILACMFKIIYRFTYMHNLSWAFPARRLNLCKIVWLQPTIDTLKHFRIANYACWNACLSMCAFSLELSWLVNRNGWRLQTTTSMSFVMCGSKVKGVGELGVWNPLKNHKWL